MNGIDLFGTAATVLSLLAMGYGIGVWHARQQHKNESVAMALSTVRDALSSICLLEFRVLSNQVTLGAQLTLEYVVENKLSTPLEVWLGADVQYGHDVWFYDITQDKTVMLQPGRVIYTRFLTIGPPLGPGTWCLNGGVWYGKKSIPEQSIRLAAGTTQLLLT